MKFRNPPVNSLSLEFLTEFVISLEKLENEKTFRGVILTSDLPGIFSAGLDLREMYGRNPAHYAEFWKAVQELWLRLYMSKLMLVSAINGASPAGGCLIALTSDYRIMADNPKYIIGLNESLLGIIAPFWLKDTFVNTIGHRAAERALQLGMLFPPAEALKVGVVDEVVPEDQIHSKARSVMAQWLALEQVASLYMHEKESTDVENVANHSRQLTKSMMRKATADKLIKQREADIQNVVSFISQDSIQKSLHVYLKKLKQKRG
ncbi:enoyl-CoA delta isomerase 1, mitochondrial isoform X1 [Cricetulus griseus]|uniref:enoyl-CoA delta isomerase 1, mitochondrial isoform X1 n=1 Tax=Cricetulus griseus TaxID=10029 RepID=UPI0015C3A38E|nr:enoyl-CoA delta isomerase 1, mitochondrial isoform X1 [Cricetulus griseus]